MFLLRTVAICSLICFVSAPASELSEQAPASPQPGDPFPVLTLPSLRDAQPASVAQFRGRKLLVHQFASW